ncbi:MAG: NnrS family protein [Pseudomonadales bacterium]|nr:NnrS family protein [Pseudomonadales bacterium]
MATSNGNPYLLTSIAFRPLFLLAVLHAVLSLALWSLWWAGVLPMPMPGNPIYWHGHEMISGFIGAAIGGFMLTAVATWTQRPPVSGAPLVFLCLAWLGARLGQFSPLAGALFDFAYWAGLLGLMTVEILRAGNRRNYKILLLLSVLLISDMAFHVAQQFFPALQRQILWGQLWLVILLINLIGGRIIPAFTRNWLLRQQTGKEPAARQPLPAEFGLVDALAISSLLVFALSTVLLSSSAWILFSGLLTGILQGWRLCRWQSHRTLSDPLVWMLHLAYAWIPIGVILLALGLAAYIPVSAGIHALTVGAIASMIVAVSSRAALGHTGRPLHSHRLLTLCIVLLNLAAVARVTAALSGAVMMLNLASVLWLAAFLCFAMVYVPILVLPAKV